MPRPAPDTPCHYHDTQHPLVPFLRDYCDHVAALDQWHDPRLESHFLTTPHRVPTAAELLDEIVLGVLNQLRHLRLPHNVHQLGPIIGHCARAVDSRLPSLFTVNREGGPARIAARKVGQAVHALLIDCKKSIITQQKSDKEWKSIRINAKSLQVPPTELKEHQMAFIRWQMGQITDHGALYWQAPHSGGAGDNPTNQTLQFLHHPTAVGIAKALKLYGLTNFANTISPQFASIKNIIQDTFSDCNLNQIISSSWAPQSGETEQLVAQRLLRAAVVSASPIPPTAPDYSTQLYHFILEQLRAKGATYFIQSLGLTKIIVSSNDLVKSQRRYPTFAPAFILQQTFSEYEFKFLSLDFRIRNRVIDEILHPQMLEEEHDWWRGIRAGIDSPAYATAVHDFSQTLTPDNPNLKKSYWIGLHFLQRKKNVPYSELPSLENLLPSIFDEAIRLIQQLGQSVIPRTELLHLALQRALWQSLDLGTRTRLSNFHTSQDTTGEQWLLDALATDTQHHEWDELDED